MLSFVRKLNPFRKASAPTPPPNIVTRSVQTDLENPFSLYANRRPSSVVAVQESNDAETIRQGIDKLLQEFENQNFKVATLMDQDGRIFFTIDLTDIIENNVDLDNIVKTVQKSILNMSDQSLNSCCSDDLSKKLKRHFLFESIKKLSAQLNVRVSLTVSDSYHTVVEKNTETQRKSDEKSAHPEANETKHDKNRQFCVSLDEKEIMSIIYNASSTLTPEVNMELIETLKSSLAIKIFKKIERTIETLKGKQVNEQDEDVSGCCNDSPDDARYRMVSRNWKPEEQQSRPRTCYCAEEQTQRPRERYRRPILSSSFSPNKDKLSAAPCQQTAHRNDPEKVENRVVAQTSVPHQTLQAGHVKVNTKNGLDEGRQDNGRNGKPESARSKQQATSRSIQNAKMRRSIQKYTCSQGRQTSTLKERRDKKLSTKRDSLKKVTQIKNSMDTVILNACVTNGRRDLLKRVNEGKKEEQKRENQAQDYKQAQREEKKKSRLKKVDTKHRKKGENNKRKLRGETIKHIRGAEEEKIVAADNGDEEVLVLFRSVEATKRSEREGRSKQRKSAVRRTGAPGWQASQVPASSEHCRKQQRTVKHSTRRKSQRKDDVDEVTTSERLIAVVSFGPSA